MIIDAHVHLGPSYKWASYESWDFGTPSGIFGPEIFLPRMKELGIDKAVIQTSKQTINNIEENNWILQVAKKYPDKLYPLVLLHPYEENVCDHLERFVEQGALGLKLHPFAGCYAIYLPTVYPVVEKAIQLMIPIMIHSGTPPHSLPTQIGLLADRFPDATFIMAHAGLSETYAADARYVALRYDNVFLETSCLPAGYAQQAIHKVGAQKVLYGSDSPWNITHSELEKLRQLNLSDDEYDLVFWKNAVDLFKIPL